MIKNSTQHSDLLLYYYNESGMHDSDRIQRAIDGDPVVGAAYNEIIDSLSQLDVPLLEPSDDTVQRILEMASVK